MIASTSVSTTAPVSGRGTDDSPRPSRDTGAPDSSMTDDSSQPPPDTGTADSTMTDDDATITSDEAPSSSATLEQGVEGTVSDPRGGPVSGALVTPTSLDTPSTAIPEVAVLTDAGGRFQWVLPAGRYRMTVTAEGRREASVETEVPAGGTSTVALQLPEG